MIKKLIINNKRYLKSRVKKIIIKIFYSHIKKIIRIKIEYKDKDNDK